MADEDREDAHEVNKVLYKAVWGFGSVRWAALALGWTTDDVQLAIWGEIRQ